MLEAFHKIEKRDRPQSMTGVPCPLPHAAIREGWEITGLKELGLPLDQWIKYATALDDAALEFYAKRKPSHG